MTHPLFDTGFYGRLRQQAGSQWHAYIKHDFVRQLGQGTLPPAAFRHYLTQDYLFLLHFARAWGLLISKLSEPAALRSATASLNAIVSELPLHQAYCQQWGISEAAMASEPEAVETLNYTRYVLDVGHTGDALELLTALMPCVAGLC
ncbi:Thiaminase-2 [Pantoea agglomerans]|uniref:Thiaminase-2 n=1 Tax=Enterobacter agglomerans TaxID=549 RepID=A0A379LS88_ENTAG|nr:Thiaminase-2 [Pantoea agglomerans]